MEYRVERVLKRDLFGAVELGRVDGDRLAVRRNVREAPLWTRPVARWLARREVRALRRVERSGGIPEVPRILHLTPAGPIRGFLPGEPMHLAEPPPSPAYFRRARALLVRLRKAGVLQFDVSKEPNWLVAPSGEPVLVDFQLALGAGRRPSRFARHIAREQLRHLLKHKRKYCPEALTDRERRILRRPSRTSVLWRRTIHRAYNIVTRRWLGWSDREGIAHATRERERERRAG